MKNKNINISNNKFFPIINYTSKGSVDEKEQIIILEKDEENYKYEALENKTFFLVVKYIPLLILLNMVTIYELSEMKIQILIGFTITIVGLVVNLRYKDELSFIVSSVWFLIISYIFALEDIAYIAKYTLISYFIMQFVFDFNRKYYKIYKDDSFVSYMFIKRDKL